MVCAYILKKYHVGRSSFFRLFILINWLVVAWFKKTGQARVYIGRKQKLINQTGSMEQACEISSPLYLFVSRTERPCVCCLWKKEWDAINLDIFRARCHQGSDTTHVCPFLIIISSHTYSCMQASLHPCMHVRRVSAAIVFVCINLYYIHASNLIILLFK
jgi:hypothetical protein